MARMTTTLGELGLGNEDLLSPRGGRPSAIWGTAILKPSWASEKHGFVTCRYWQHVVV